MRGGGGSDRGGGGLRGGGGQVGGHQRPRPQVLSYLSHPMSVVGCFYCPKGHWTS